MTSKTGLIRQIGTYVCQHCERRTHPHNVCSDSYAADIELCDECCALSEIATGVSDGCPIECYEIEIRRHMADLKRLGVNADVAWPEMAEFLKGV